MTESRGSKPKVKAKGANSPKGPKGRGEVAGRAPERSEALRPIEASDLLDPEATGRAADGYYQATAMFDKAELLGELAELARAVPDTRAAVEAEPAGPRGCRLIVVAGPGIGTEWSFKQPEIFIGRDQDCQIIMPDIGASRRHATIALQGDHFFITDLGSGNGTFLNGARIEHEQLESGDEVVVGERTLRFVELNEAPSTSAAQPVPHPLMAPAQVQSVPKVLAAQDPAASQAEVAAVSAAVQEPVQDPALADPKGQPSVVAAVTGAVRERRQKLVAAAAVLGLLLLAFAGYRAYRSHRDTRAAEERLETSHRQFLQAVELVKQRRYGDALVLLDRVLAVRADYARAADYKAFCEAELKVWDTIEAARRLAESGRLAEALGLLEGVKGDTAYAGLLEVRKGAYARTLAETLLKDARAKFQAGDLDGALELAEAALTQAPGLDSAQRLRDQIEDAKKLANRPKPKPREPVPPELQRALSLYLNEEIGPAIDAAEAAGGPKAPAFVQRLQRMKQLVADISTAHRQKAAGDILRLAPTALQVDDEIAAGEGRVRAQLRSAYADGLYLKAIDADQDDDLPRAYQLLTEALRQQPGHALSEARLQQLSKKARELYYQGFVAKDSNPEDTRKIFRRLTMMSKPDNQYHRLAQKWLAENGG